jgi:hypothetical protein
MGVFETRTTVNDVDSGPSKPFCPSIALIARDPFLVMKEFVDGRFPP